MDNKFSKSWINMRVDYDNISRRTVLVDHISKLPKEDDIDLIDLYCGSGNFLIWSLDKNILFNNCILVDHDIKLLKSIKSNLRTHLKSKYTIQSNTNNLNLLFNTDEGKNYLTKRKGFKSDFVDRLPEFGFSSIANIIASIKLAKKMKLTKNDAIITVATDGADLYETELAKTKKQFSKIYDQVTCAEIFAKNLLYSGSGINDLLPNPSIILRISNPLSFLITTLCGMMFFVSTRWVLSQVSKVLNACLISGVNPSLKR